jgi:arsenic resistance protein ArsH
MSNITNGDLNNTGAERARDEISVDAAYSLRSFAISQSEDDSIIREKYRPFLLKDDVSSNDWVARLELSTVLKMVETHGLNSNDKRLRVLVLHGSMRSR